MNKTTKFISQALIFTFLVNCMASCNSESAKELSTNTTGIEPTETELLLADYNNSLPDIADTRARRTDKNLDIAVADAKGAYKGGKIGGKIGGVFGPHGRIVGTIIGGVLVGGAKSYIKYRENVTIKGDMMTAPALNSEILNINSFACAYADNKSKVDASEYKYGRDRGLDSCATVTGILHNRVLENVEMHKDPQKFKVYLSTLTDIELYVLESEEMKNVYDSIFCEEELDRNSQVSSDESDRIMSLFMAAVEENVASAEELNKIIKYYTEVVTNSSYLSQVQKGSLLAAFSVMGYSYEYWSDKLKD